MQGYNIIAYIGAELKKGFNRPIGATKIIKTHASSYDEAVAEKRRMEQEFGGIVQLRS